MRYFEAYEIDTRPFILFNLIANDASELTAEQAASDIVVDEDNLPSYEYGICHKRIQNGALIDRSATEIVDYQNKYNAAVNVYSAEAAGADVKATTFTYDGNKFPMTQAADQQYRAVENAVVTNGSSASYNINSTAGVYVLTAANVPAFLTAYYITILELANLNQA